MNYGQLRYYFHVDTSSVLRKLGLFLFPFRPKVARSSRVAIPFDGSVLTSRDSCPG